MCLALRIKHNDWGIVYPSMNALEKLSESAVVKDILLHCGLGVLVGLILALSMLLAPTL